MTNNIKIGDLVEPKEGKSPFPQGSVLRVYDIIQLGPYTFLALSEYDAMNCDGWDADYFIKYEPKEKQMRVELGKKYRMVGTHEPVRIICVDRVDSEIPCVALYHTGKSEGVLCLDSTGKIHNSGQQIIEEVPAVDWGKVQVDSPIWVKCSEAVYKRHFCKYENGYVFFWTAGQTSFTCTSTCPLGSAYPANCSLEEPK